MSGAEQALAELREVAGMPPGVKSPLSQSSAVELSNNKSPNGERYSGVIGVVGESTGIS